MSIILSGSQKIQITTTSVAQVDMSAFYVDITSTTTAGSYSLQRTTSATTIDLIGSPSANTQRAIKDIILKNVSSFDHTITASLSASTGIYQIYCGIIEASGSAEWHEGTGWRKMSSGSYPQICGGNTIFDIQRFSTTGSHTWTKPTAFSPQTTYVMLWGAGGGGGGGTAENGGFSFMGGAGGGGGAFNYGIFRTSTLPSTVTVTVGSGGLGGSGRGYVNNPVSAFPGASGTSSSFGSYISAYGGGGGGEGRTRFTTSAAGGGGGGSGGTGESGTGKTSTYASGGDPFYVPAVATIPIYGMSGFGGGLSHPTGSTGAIAEYGGSGGASIAWPNIYNGSVSIFGGCGGGHGAYYSSTIISGSAGGYYMGLSGSSGGGGNPGSNGTSVSGVAATSGSKGPDGVGSKGGGGGGGGGHGNFIAAGVGGQGGLRGGGGGGGGGCTTNILSGAMGGRGGDGEVIVISW